MSTWNIDVAHTNLGFTVKHMMVSKVRGNFNEFEGKIEGNPEDLASSKVSFKVDMNSINTNNEDRDNHLRSEDFFEEIGRACVGKECGLRWLKSHGEKMRAERV